MCSLRLQRFDNERDVDLAKAIAYEAAKAILGGGEGGTGQDSDQIPEAP